MSFENPTFEAAGKDSAAAAKKDLDAIVSEVNSRRDPDKSFGKPAYFRPEIDLHLDAQKSAKNDIFNRLPPILQNRIQAQVGPNIASLSMFVDLDPGEKIATLYVSYRDAAGNKSWREIEIEYPSSTEGDGIKVMPHEKGPYVTRMMYRPLTVSIDSIAKGLESVFGNQAPSQPETKPARSDAVFRSASLGAPDRPQALEAPRDYRSREIFDRLTPATQKQLRETMGNKIGSVFLTVLLGKDEKTNGKGTLVFSFVDATYTRLIRKVDFSWKQPDTARTGTIDPQSREFLAINTSPSRLRVLRMTYIPMNAIEEALKPLLS